MLHSPAPFRASQDPLLKVARPKYTRRDRPGHAAIDGIRSFSDMNALLAVVFYGRTDVVPSITATYI
jgi:hypothetical protein